MRLHRYPDKGELAKGEFELVEAFILRNGDCDCEKDVFGIGFLGEVNLFPNDEVDGVENDEGEDEKANGEDNVWLALFGDCDV